GGGGVEHRKKLWLWGGERPPPPPLSVTSQTSDDRSKNALPAASLRQIEARKHERRDGNPDRGASCQGLIRFQCNKRQKTEDREQKLCCSLDEHVDDDARRRERARNGVQRQQTRADEIAADLRQRQ